MKIVETNDFTVEDLGEKDIYVYDIEVEQNHNFFANDILVHNSNYFSLDKLFERFPHVPESKKVDFLNDFGEKFIRPVFEKTFENIFKKTNSFQQEMFMDREVIAQRGIWTGKKRYILNVWDNEGTRYPKPKQKIMGMEAIRSTYPEVCRNKIKEAMIIMLERDNEELLNFIAEFREEFKSLPLQDISENTSVGGIRKYYDKDTGYYIPKGTPHHVKASYGYNRLIDNHSLGGEHEKIHDGTKIKLLNLIHPNPTGEKKIAFINYIPEEFGIDDYVHYDSQFDKTFLNPVKSLTDVIGWDTKRNYNLNFLIGK